MIVYLDTSVLIPYLYQEREEPGLLAQMQRFFDAVRAGHLEAWVSFYVLPELYDFVGDAYETEKAPEVFRESLVVLFSEPVIVRPYLDRSTLSLWRRRFTISDSDDVLHVAAALAWGCDAIVTYDHHFFQVKEHIPVGFPDECLEVMRRQRAEGEKDEDRGRG